MKPHRCQWVPGALAAMTAMLLLSAPSSAQPGAKGRLIQGSADVIHDLSGIAIGMPCDQAKSRANQLSQNGNIRDPSGLVGGYRANLDGARVEMQWDIYRVNLGQSGNMSFSCANDGTGKTVFEIERNISLEGNGTNPPAVASVNQIFEEKFGVPTVTYDPFNLAILFNEKGPITSKENGCGQYYGGQFSDAIVEFHPDKCTYTLDFVATQSRDKPGTISWIKIHIFDHLRLENAVRALEKHKLETTPVAVPKL